MNNRVIKCVIDQSVHNMYIQRHSINPIIGQLQRIVYIDPGSVRHSELRNNRLSVQRQSSHLQSGIFIRISSRAMTDQRRYLVNRPYLMAQSGDLSEADCTPLQLNSYCLTVPMYRLSGHTLLILPIKYMFMFMCMFIKFH